MKKFYLLVPFLVSLLTLSATPSRAAGTFQPALQKLPATALICAYQGPTPQQEGNFLRVQKPAGVVVARISPGTEPEEAGPAASLHRRDDVHFTSRNSLAALSFRTSSAITPYLGAGMGYELAFAPQKLSPADRFLAAHDRFFSYRVGAGFGCSLDPTTSLALDYRYTTNTAPDPADMTTGKDGHNISLGLKVTF